MFSLLSAEKDLEEDSLKRIIKFLAGFIEKVIAPFLFDSLSCGMRPNVVGCRSEAGVWQSGRDAQFSSVCGLTSNTNTKFMKTKKLTYQNRISTPNNSPTNLPPDSPDARLKDNGTMSRTRLVYCSTRMRISRRWSRVDSRLCRLVLE
jgi:hypothetical protein